MFDISAVKCYYSLDVYFVKMKKILRKTWNKLQDDLKFLKKKKKRNEKLRLQSVSPTKLTAMFSLVQTSVKFRHAYENLIQRWLVIIILKGKLNILFVKTNEPLII